VAALTVGQVAEQFGVTVRTLHHYDRLGLLVPSERTPAGYRLYTDEDVTRLQHVVVYRRLGFALAEIANLLDERALADGGSAADGGAVIGHLRRQRAAVLSRLGEMRDLVTAIDQALEKEMSGIRLTKEEQAELFGDAFSDDYAEEAEQRWGETEASERAMDAAEQHRQHIHHRFYDLTPEVHRGLGDMYLADPRFTKTYEDIKPGMAQYVRDAIHANADRAARATDEQP